MDLPTYTSIWRIEKRLYKLYDFRLPMPLPIGQISVFAAIAVPYVVLLGVLGLPFNHTLIWLYILPPGALTWLATRPVIEGKRLPELIKSQVRYLAEPRVWCRMAPSSERDVVLVTGRVWRSSRAARRPATTAAAAPRYGRGPAPRRADRAASRPAGRGPAWTARRGTAPEGTAPGGTAGRWLARRGAADGLESDVAPGGRPPSRGRHPARANRDRAAMPAVRAPARIRGAAPVRSDRPAAPGTAGRIGAGRLPAGRNDAEFAGPDLPDEDLTEGLNEDLAEDLNEDLTEDLTEDLSEDLSEDLAEDTAAFGPVAAGPAAGSAAGPAADDWEDAELAGSDVRGGEQDRGGRPGTEWTASRSAGAAWPDDDGADGIAADDQAAHDDRAGSAPRVGWPAGRPVITRITAPSGSARPPSVERALAGPAARRGDARPGRVTVVPGGDRPGNPDQLQRDRARARLPVVTPIRIVVLGCTVGAGQTVTALMTGDVLAGLRSDRVAVIDLNPGPGSLARRALARPALSHAASLGPSRLAVVRSAQLAGVEGIGEPDQPGPADEAQAVEFAARHHDIVIADPSTAAVPRLLAIADQLMLVAPASAAAASSIVMTFEWLEAHGQAGLASGAIMMLNGVSRRSMPHVEQAERVSAGRCRAIVRVPWDDQLGGQAVARAHPPRIAPGSARAGSGQRDSGQRDSGRTGGQAGTGQRWTGVLGPAAVSAYTALAGVLIAAAAERTAGQPPGSAVGRQERGRR